jgi:hypothetical protein
MRLTNERDQEILKAGISDTAASLLEFMPTMGTGEAISFGEGVALPTRIKFDMLPASALPRSSTASFTGNWSRDVKDENFVADVVARWRNQALGSIDSAGHAEAAGEPAATIQPPPAPPASPGLAPPAPRFGQAAAAAPPQRPLAGQPLPAQSQSPSSIRNQAASQPQSLAALLRQLKPN